MNTKEITYVAFDIVKTLRGETHKKPYEIKGITDQQTALEVIGIIFNILQENGYNKFNRINFNPFLMNDIHDIKIPVISDNKIVYIYSDDLPKDNNGIIMLYDHEIYSKRIREFIENILNDAEEGYKLPNNWFVITFPEMPY